MTDKIRIDTSITGDCPYFPMVVRDGSEQIVTVLDDHTVLIGGTTLESATAWYVPKNDALVVRDFAPVEGPQVPLRLALKALSLLERQLSHQIIDADRVSIWDRGDEMVFSREHLRQLNELRKEAGGDVTIVVPLPEVVKGEKNEDW